MVILKTNVWAVGALAFAGFPALAADNTPPPPANKEIAGLFVAEAKGDTVSIYSNLKRDRRCDVFVYFSVAQDGKRVSGNLRCFEKDLRKGNHVLTCDIQAPAIIDPKIESPVDGFCK